MPHTVQLDPKGRPWYSGNKNGSIGWIDPATGKATVYKMPDPAAKDSHTIAFDKRGSAYFTFQHANNDGAAQSGTQDIKAGRPSPATSTRASCATPALRRRAIAAAGEAR